MEKINARPVLDRMIIKQDEGEEKVGVLFVSDTAKEKPRSGIVVAVGDGAIGYSGERLPMMAKIGDRVVYQEFAGQPVEINGIPYLVIKEGDLLYIL
jgi:chaperonin GroES